MNFIIKRFTLSIDTRFGKISALVLVCLQLLNCQAEQSGGTASSGKSIIASHGVVASADSIASAIGTEILSKGGNAIDAAVATALALAVTYPQAGNLGGGGFMLIRMAGGETKFIDYREKAPLKASRDMYLDGEGHVIEGLSTKGHLAAGVPGTVAGLAMAHRMYGSVPWNDVVEPAYRTAKDGFFLDGALARRIRSKRELFALYQGSRAIFNHHTLRPGELFVQSDLAGTLKRIMEEGEQDFYRGETASLIVMEMEAGGGLITPEDLDQYQPVLREPVRVSYRGYEVIGAPLPSSGGIILSMLLQLIEPASLASLGFHSAEAVHLISEAEKIVYRLRALYMGDEDFYAAPWRELIRPAYVNKLKNLINRSSVLPIDELEALDLFPRSKGKQDIKLDSRGFGPAGELLMCESEETTHFSVVDRWGNAVANTYTLNSAFGSGVTVNGAGFLLNNQMDDFSIKPGFPNIYGLVGAEANAIEPGKRMLSSMSPTIVLKDGRLFMVLGTPGGATIPTSVFQVITNVIDYGMSLEQAVSAARFHEQYLPDEIFIETGALGALVVGELESLGHKVVERSDIGDVHAIIASDGKLFGVSDPRGVGKAIGY